ncbi:MAG: hypothetical protein DWG76_00520 [Chloroflexi bacterium]|nr:hypothetical protein [Chloroflexota bacterium]MQC25921.1 hypothetical protein [Chloroflexota bacterium]
MINRGFLRQIKFPVLHKNLAWGALVLGALLAFEAFNYSTTEFAMRDLLGDLRFGGIGWSTILALAFCSIDFAGIAHMFSNGPKSAKEGLEIWYLFAAWLLAATMNATLTWWGVSIAIIQHGTLGNGIVARETLLTVVPAFVAVLVWMIRVLIIGTLITSSGKLFRTLAPERSVGRNDVPAMRRQAYQTRRPSPAPKPVAFSQNGNAVAHSMNGNGYSNETIH